MVVPGRAKVGRRPVRRGEIRWYTFAAPDKRRPVLLLTRSTVIDTLNELIVVPATRTIRGLATEVVLSTDDGVALHAQRQGSLQIGWQCARVPRSCSRRSPRVAQRGTAHRDVVS